MSEFLSSTCLLSSDTRRHATRRDGNGEAHFCGFSRFWNFFQIRRGRGSGCCVHCFVRSTGVGISRTRPAQVHPRRVPPLARAVRRPLVDRQPTPAPLDAFRRRRRVFSFLPRGCRVNNEPSASPARGASGAAAPRQAPRACRARASRDVLCVCASLTSSPPLPTAPSAPRFLTSEKARGSKRAFPSARRFRRAKGRTATAFARSWFVTCQCLFFTEPAKWHHPR